MSRILSLKYVNFIALLLVAAMMLTHFTGQRMSQFARVVPASQVVMQKSNSTCQQAKTAQAQAGRSCQTLFGKVAILSDIIQFFYSFTGKLYFLFVLGMLAVSHHRRLFKPPKQFIFA